MVICMTASRWQKVTRKWLQTTAGSPASSHFAPQNVFCIQYGLFKVRKPASKRASSAVETVFEILQSPSPSEVRRNIPPLPAASTRHFLYKAVVQLWPVLTKPPLASSPGSFCCRKSWGCANHNVWKVLGNIQRALLWLRQKPAVYSFNKGVLSIYCVTGSGLNKSLPQLFISSCFPSSTPDAKQALVLRIHFLPCN